MARYEVHAETCVLRVRVVRVSRCSGTSAFFEIGMSEMTFIIDKISSCQLPMNVSLIHWRGVGPLCAPFIAASSDARHVIVVTDDPVPRKRPFLRVFG